METEQDLEIDDKIIEDNLDEIQEMKTKNVFQFKIFNIYDISNIKINDPGLKRYINLNPKLVIKSYGRIREKFSRAKINLLELFANLVAVPGHRGKKHKIQTSWKTGKYSQNMKIVLDCLKIIENRLKQNPIQILVTAIENVAPKDGITIIEYGGARYPQAADISPSKRVSMALRAIVHGSYDKSFNKKTKIEEALANEIIKAYYKENDSYAIQKKKESEKAADSAR